ncbi:MAG: 16S rRNA (uracil(1498)-N(3))-methyltransferase [Chitinispirillaceae bacterium]|nr:16S rRNA (uracil(1498)-N(3))-methyltransferase [Chitinispirillaceae bacterium]
MMNLVLLEPADFIDARQRIVCLTGRRLTHIRSVCHAIVGERLRVGLIDGHVGHGMVMRIDDETLEMEVTLSEPPPPPLPLTLIFALPRPKSLKKSIEAATSLGIKKIFIIESWRVEKNYWSSPSLAPESLREQMLLGLEQARDTVLPDIEIRRRFKPFVEDELPGLIVDSFALVAHPYEAQPCPSCPGKQVVLMIGPEGGFIPYEIERLRETGFLPVTIGKRILRVETAIAAFAGRLW